MFYWTLFLILYPDDTSLSEKYFGIQTFESRRQCEMSILKKEIIKTNLFNGKLSCIKTDEKLDANTTD